MIVSGEPQGIDSKSNPLSVTYIAEGELVRATVVDHIKPNRGN